MSRHKRYYATGGMWETTTLVGVETILEDGGPVHYKLIPRLDLARHSQTGFGWGYAGSGPAQLSLAILADLLADDERALRLYQRFKFAVVANLPKDRGWTLSAQDVWTMIGAIEDRNEDLLPREGDQ